MSGFGMPFMQKGRRTFAQTIITSSGLTKQALLRVAREFSPQPHNGEAKGVFKVGFVIGHFSYSYVEADNQAVASSVCVCAFAISRS
jgi:hypothetical protein